MYLCKKNCVYRAIIYLCLLVTVLSYDNRCPYFPERSILSKQCSNEEPFHCLMDDNSKRYIQKCRKWEWVANGSFPVLSGKYIYYKDCSLNTYQPIIYKSNEGHKCSFTKSRCNELGHVTVDNGTTVTDRFCCCDHTRGYALVNGLAPGSCNPFLEDCSCYSKGIGLGQIDFICGPEDKVDILVMERNTINRSLVKTQEETITGNVMQQHEYRKYVITALVVISLILSLVNISVTVLFKNDTNEDKNEETIVDKRLTNSAAKFEQVSRPPIIQSTNEDIPEDRALVDTFSVSAPQTDYEERKLTANVKGQYNSTIARPQSTQTTKTQPVIDDTTSKAYIVQSNLADNVQMRSLGYDEDQYNSTIARPQSTPTIKTQPVIEDKTSNSVDILILDLEHPPDKAKVIEFKDHLRSLVPERCYRDIQIKLFDEINIHTASTKQIMLPELFNRCKYLFVYISKHHMPSKATQKGLSEKDLVSAMKTSEYRNMITVCDCDDWNYPDKYRTDLNYFDYKQSKDCEAYKSFLRRLLQTLP